MCNRILRLAALSVLFLGALQAQGPVSVSVILDQSTISVSPGSSVVFNSDAIGSTVTGTLVITYRGAAGAVNNSLVVTDIGRGGSNDFSIDNANLPISIIPGANVITRIRFKASSGTKADGTVNINYQEFLGLNTPAAPGLFSFSISGTAPDPVFNYTLPGGNALPIQTGGTLVIPTTLLSTTKAVSFAVTNRGSGPVEVTGISAAGSTAFQLVGLPLPPTTVDAGRELRFTINFTPKVIDPQTGTVRITYGKTSVVTVNIQGDGATAAYSYDVVRIGGIAPLKAGTTLTIADTLLNEKSTIQIQVRNTGNAEGVLSLINILGTGYQLANLPFLPVTMAPGASTIFNVEFAPTVLGRSAGRLRVGDDTFDLVSNGIGALVNYSYTLGATTNPVQPNGSILFSPIQAGRELTAQFVISNTGTLETTIGAIFLANGTTSFRLANLPALPLVLGAGKSTTFDLIFSPTATGVADGTLRVGNQNFGLVGSATAPPPLPNITLDGPTGTIQALQQPAYGLTLSAAYPIALSGVLTLGFNPEVFVNDPAIQFATGGRTANFTIPAGATKAVFASDETTVRLQTGSVAGTISLTPAIQTSTGINLTPANPPRLSITIPQTAPQISGVQLGSKSATNITLLISGYSTGRAITGMTLTITPVAGENISNLTAVINVDSAFTSWFQSPASQPFGSQFTATLPINLEGKAGTAATLADAIKTIGVVISNAAGASAAKSIDLR